MSLFLVQNLKKEGRLTHIASAYTSKYVCIHVWCCCKYKVQQHAMFFVGFPLSAITSVLLDKNQQKKTRT